MSMQGVKIDYESIFEGLSKQSAKYSRSMVDLQKARLSSLTLTDEHKTKGDLVFERLADTINSVDQYVHDSNNSKVLANQSIAELSGLRNDTDITNPKYLGLNLGRQAEFNLLDTASDSISNASIFALINNDKSQWHKKVTSLFNEDTYDFLKGSNKISNLSSLNILTQSMKGVLFNKAGYDGFSVGNSLANLGSTISYKRLSDALTNKDEGVKLAFPLFCVVGRDVAANLYNVAVAENNADYAMSLLAGNKHSFIEKGNEYVSSDPQIKALISVVSSSEDSKENLSKLANLDVNEDSKANLLNNIVLAHNHIHNKDNLASMFENMKGSLTQKQLSKIALTLFENYNKQPILPALESLIRKAGESGLSDTQLRKIQREVEVKLQDEVGALDKSAVSYSTVRIDLPESNQTIPLNSIRSIEHLERVLTDNGISSTNDMNLFGSNSYLDKTVKEAAYKLLNEGDSKDLRHLLETKVKNLDLDLERKSELLFNANKQQAEIVVNHDSENYKLLSEVGKSDDFIYNKGQPIAKVSELRSADDFLSAIKGLYDYEISMDDLGLGERFKSELEQLLEDTANSKDNLVFINKLNTTLRLPVSYLSSKIEETQVKTIEQHEVTHRVAQDIKDDKNTNGVKDKAVKAIDTVKNAVRLKR